MVIIEDLLVKYFCVSLVCANYLTVKKVFTPLPGIVCCQLFEETNYRHSAESIDSQFHLQKQIKRTHAKSTYAFTFIPFRCIA